MIFSFLFICILCFEYRIFVEGGAFTTWKKAKGQFSSEGLLVQVLWVTVGIISFFVIFHVHFLEEIIKLPYVSFKEERVMIVGVLTEI